MRHYSIFDKLCLQFDSALKTLAPSNTIPARLNPAATISEANLTAAEKQQAAALMRINHVGEVCAQALYQGQALTAKLPEIRGQMQQAASEQLDHLSWCAQRIGELDGHTSYLNPLWYVSAFIIL
jgi:ubiquinone biosynthesis monooxygenase Coq7